MLLPVPRATETHWFSYGAQGDTDAGHWSRRLQKVFLEAGIKNGYSHRFRHTFARPASDPAYRTNRLQPGVLPLEWSFSEAGPDALRIEFQPFDPDLAPEERLKCAITQLLRVGGHA